MIRIDFIDSHTAGEPTRVILAGLPDFGGGPLAERRLRMQQQHDRWRRAVVLEPRGSDTVVGALLVPAQDPRACTGVIFFNNVGYLGMCGHGTIGVARTLAHLGRIEVGRHWLETPVGLVGIELHADGRVSVDNVESWRHAHDVTIEVPDYGRIRGDVAWGGNWFFISHDLPCPIETANVRELTTCTVAIFETLRREGIHGADGQLAPGARWRQAGILGSVFEASYRPGTRGILPRITGHAALTGEGHLLIEEDDAFGWGIPGA